MCIWILLRKKYNMYSSSMCCMRFTLLKRIVININSYINGNNCAPCNIACSKCKGAANSGTDCQACAVGYYFSTFCKSCPT